jgi:ComF family protein
MWDHFLDLVFPRTSLRGREGEWITDREMRSILSSPTVLERAELEAMGVHAVSRVVAASAYGSAPLLQRAVRTLKYRRIPSLAQPLGSLLVSASDLLQIHPGITLCPVPLHWMRRFHRGFNQAELLARIVSQERGWPLTHCLRRHRSTGAQANRSHMERRHALDGAFVARPPVPSHIVLVDDIVTTGSTLEACASALRQAGVADVQALALALGS